MTVTAMGSFSGSLQVGGARHPISGQLDADGNAQVTIPRSSQDPLTVNLRTQTARGEDEMTGTVSDGKWTAELFGDAVVFDGEANVAPQAGQYTLVIPGNAGSTGEPVGKGTATVSVDKAGRILLAGTLADGTRITQSGSLSRNGQWPLYLALCNGQGSVLGWMTFTHAPEFDLQGNLSWIKPSLPLVNAWS